MHRKRVLKAIGITIVIALLAAAILAAVPSTIAAVFSGDAATVGEEGGVTIWAILMGIIAAAAFALSGFFNGKLEKAAIGKTEPFDVAKLIATAVMGVIFGVILTVTGVAVTEENVIGAFFAYSGLTAYAYKIIKGILVYYGWIAAVSGEPS
jgi:Na+-driven multidrug efflux pump